MVMVFKSFGYRPSPWDWSNLFFFFQKVKKENKIVYQIGTLYLLMIT